jgi:hypothetical protein
MDSFESAEYVIKPYPKTEEAPETETKADAISPPVHDSAKEIVIFLFLRILTRA